MIKRKFKLIYGLATAAALAVSVTVLAMPQDHIWKAQHETAQAKPVCTQHDDSVFCSHLPVISIETNGQEIPGMQREKDVITTDVKVYDSQTANNHLTDQPALTMLANIRYRGNSSLHFDKHSYYFKTVNENGEAEDYSIMGMPEHSDWVLNGPFLDKTLMRNYMAMNLYGKISGYAPRVRYCELWLDGSYQGVYLMMERVSQGEERVNITQTDEDDPFCSYIIRLDRGDTPENELNSFSEYAMKLSPDTPLNKFAINVEYPGALNLTEEKKAYIEDDLSRIEKAIYSYDYDSKEYGYTALLDVDSFVDYFIFNEFLQNYDAGAYSTYFYKDIRGKLTAGPVWDFNNACDNYMETAFDGTGFSLQDGYLYFMLMKDEKFVEKIIERYRELREGVLSEEYLMDFIDDTEAYLGDAVDRNYSVWGYSFQAEKLDNWNRLLPVHRNPSSYEEAVEDLKKFLVKRGDWMDENIENLRQYCHESANKRFNH